MRLRLPRVLRRFSDRGQVISLGSRVVGGASQHRSQYVAGRVKGPGGLASRTDAMEAGVQRSRHVIALGLVIVTLAGASGAPAQPAEVEKAATEPIMRQLEAFRRGDYDAAYVFASAEIKQMFDREAFERMVKDGYPEIARSAFALVSRTEVGPDGHVYVHVRVKGANGVGIEALYEMVRERDAWRINSVMTRRDPGLVLAPLPSRDRAA